MRHSNRDVLLASLHEENVNMHVRYNALADFIPSGIFGALRSYPPNRPADAILGLHVPQIATDSKLVNYLLPKRHALLRLFGLGKFLLVFAKQVIHLVS